MWGTQCTLLTYLVLCVNFSSCVTRRRPRVTAVWMTTNCPYIHSPTEIVNRTRYWPPLPGQRHFPTQHHTLTSLSSCLSSVADLPPSSPTGLVNTSVNTCSNLMKEAAGLGCTHQKPRKDCKQPQSFVRDVYQSRKFAWSLGSCQ